MSQEEKQLNCVVCKAYLFEEDDVVHCPICGAPHHRDCYNKTGHCALEELHGTPDEYNPEKVTENEGSDKNGREPINDSHTVRCRVCGNEYDDSLGKCPNCSAPDFGKMGGGYAQFDFLGGVPKDLEIEDGVTAEDARKFVFSNTHRYIPKFVSLNKKKRASWNWIAFLMPAPWMFSRKMYKGGIITAFIELLSTILLFPLIIHFEGLGIPSTESSGEMVYWMMEKMPSAPPEILIVSAIATLLSIAVSIFVGIYADYIYKKHTVSSVKEIKANSEDIEADYRKKGGVNFILFFLSYMLLQYIPQIIAIFI